MEENYATDDLREIARATAQRVGWEALTWWQDRSDPRFLRIEAVPQNLTVTEPPTIITLHAFLS